MPQAEELIIFVSIIVAGVEYFFDIVVSLEDEGEAIPQIQNQSLEHYFSTIFFAEPAFLCFRAPVGFLHMNLSNLVEVESL